MISPINGNLPTILGAQAGYVMGQSPPHDREDVLTENALIPHPAVDDSSACSYNIARFAPASRPGHYFRKEPGESQLMRYAIIQSGGKQYKAVEGKSIEVDKLDLEVGKTLELKDVLLVSDGDKVLVGTPVVADAIVAVKVVEQGKGDKVTVFKYKPKIRYRVKTGHRQDLTRLQVQSIDVKGLPKSEAKAEEAPKAQAKAEAQPPKAPAAKAAKPKAAAKKTAAKKTAAKSKSKK
jgi:large subunit ribosomal protein L21